MSDKKYTPGYIEVPGKGTRYRNSSGEYFLNHWGSIGNSFGNVGRSVESGYNSYYDSVADATGGERRDGSIKPKASKKPRKGKSVIRAFGKEFDTSDPKQKAEYDKLQAAELKRQRGRSEFSDLRGGDGLKEDGNTRFDAPPKPSPYVKPENQQGREPGKLSSAGFAEANGLLARLGITTTRYGDFESVDLPVAQGTNRIGGSDRDGTVGVGPNGTTAPAHASKYTTPKPVEAEQTQGSPKLTQPGAQQTTKPISSAGMGTLQRYGQEFMADRPGMPAQYNESLVGLRAAEASKGLLYASGKYWKANPNAGGEGQKDFVEISKAEWNTIKRGDQHATQYKPPAENIADMDTQTDAWKESAQNFKDDYVGLVQQQMKGIEPKSGSDRLDEADPVSPIDGTAAVKNNIPQNGAALTAAPDVRLTGKDRTGRFNNFNNR